MSMNAKSRVSDYTSQMTEESKARRDKALAAIEKKLFSNNDEVWGLGALEIKE